MPRTRSDDKFPQLLEAAAAVFIEQGYRRTQMSDIAAALGVAKGTLYLYVESKEALFDAALRYIDRVGAEGERPARFPVPTPDSADTLAYVRGELATHSHLPSLAAALSGPPAADTGAELAGILSDLFDVLARNRRRLKLLDRSAKDYPEIAALWFEGARGGLLGLLEAYLRDRIGRGTIDVRGEVGVATRLLLESIVFWAVHRHWDMPPATAESAELTDEEIRATVVSMLVRALVQESRR